MTIGWIILVLFGIACHIFLLYQFSELLLSGIENGFASSIAYAIGGYIFLTILGVVLAVFCGYWVFFSQEYDWEFRHIRSDLEQIGKSIFTYWRISSNSDDLVYSEIKERLNGTLTKNDFDKKFSKIEKKIDQLIEQQK
jgi:hypothetical protein